MSLPTASPEALGFCSERLARIEPWMQGLVAGRGFGGVTTAIARRGRLVHLAKAGWQDREAGIPLAPDTIHRIYSMTKPIVCTALMTLFEEGRFQLGDPLAKYLPAFARMQVQETAADGSARLVDARRPILVRDLFTHTSGLCYDFLEESPVSALYREAGLMADAGRTLEALVGEIARMPLGWQPGSSWHYCVGIDVIGHLVEVLAGRPLQDVLAERLFRPLGMNDTGFSVAPAARPRIAAMYGNLDITIHPLSEVFVASQTEGSRRRDVERTNPSDNTVSFARGGHGLFSTTGDYLRFAQMLLGRGELDGVRVLAPKTAELMHANHLPAALLPFELVGLPALGYGFGLGSRVLMDVAASGLPGSVGEFGWSGAAKTYYWVDPREEIVGLFMTQYMACMEKPEAEFQALCYQALLG